MLFIFRLIDNNDNPILYRLTHKNHPSNIWARSSKENYEWLYSLFYELCKEYTYRYGKIHASARLIPLFKSIIDKVPNDIPLTPFAIVVKDQLGSNDAVLEYRHLYRTAKRDICTWKNRDIPYWFNE